MSRFLEVGGAVFVKEMRSEWRSRELLPTIGQFVVLALVIANFAFDVERTGSYRVAPGILWLTLLFALLLTAGRTFTRERDLGSLDAVLMTPASRAAILAGKAAGATVLLVASEAVLLPALGLLLGAPVVSPKLWGAILLATVGMSAAGCLFAAIAVQTRARDVLLPVLLLPLCLPIVVVGGRVAQVAMGAPGNLDWQPFGLLLDFDILFGVAAALAAGYVLDD